MLNSTRDLSKMIGKSNHNPLLGKYLRWIFFTNFRVLVPTVSSKTIGSVTIVVLFWIPENTFDGFLDEFNTLLESYKIRYCIVLFWLESGKTPADKAGIEIQGDNKWLTLIQNVTKKTINLTIQLTRCYIS